MVAYRGALGLAACWVLINFLAFPVFVYASKWKDLECDLGLRR
jgi:hypothetical protein